MITLQGNDHISPTSRHFWVDDVPFSAGGICDGSLQGIIPTFPGAAAWEYLPATKQPWEALQNLCKVRIFYALFQGDKFMFTQRCKIEFRYPKFCHIDLILKGDMFFQSIILGIDVFQALHDIHTENSSPVWGPKNSALARKTSLPWSVFFVF